MKLLNKCADYSFGSNPFGTDQVLYPPAIVIINLITIIEELFKMQGYNITIVNVMLSK